MYPIAARLLDRVVLVSDDAIMTCGVRRCHMRSPPRTRCCTNHVRCTTNPLGVKGVGEAGTTASLAAVMNAVADAGANIDMPATPERVWRALSAHGGGT
jgi:carbon-monoxide dehydrogenase large subunit